MMITSDYYQCQHVRSMTAGRCLKCLEENKTAAPTTSNISNARTELDTIKDTLNMSNLSDFAKEGIMKALTTYLQQQQSALLNELLESRKAYWTAKTAESKLKHAVPVSVIQAKLKDLNQGEAE